MREARKRLASMVQRRYLGREGGEPVKLCAALKFIRAHDLCPLLGDEALLRPVLSSFCDNFVQHTFTLCQDDREVQCRLVGYALRCGKRRAAGRLVARFRLSGEALAPPQGWPAGQDFTEACRACHREAEAMEELLLLL